MRVVVTAIVPMATTEFVYWLPADSSNPLVHALHFKMGLQDKFTECAEAWRAHSAHMSQIWLLHADELSVHELPAMHYIDACAVSSYADGKVIADVHYLAGLRFGADEVLLKTMRLFFKAVHCDAIRVHVTRADDVPRLLAQFPDAACDAFTHVCMLDLRDLPAVVSLFPATTSMNVAKLMGLIPFPDETPLPELLAWDPSASVDTSHLDSKGMYEYSDANTSDDSSSDVSFEDEWFYEDSDSDSNSDSDSDSDDDDDGMVIRSKKRPRNSTASPAPTSRKLVTKLDSGQRQIWYVENKAPFQTLYRQNGGPTMQVLSRGGLHRAKESYWLTGTQNDPFYDARTGKDDGTDLEFKRVKNFRQRVMKPMGTDPYILEEVLSGPLSAPEYKQFSQRVPYTKLLPSRKQYFFADKAQFDVANTVTEEWKLGLKYDEPRFERVDGQRFTACFDSRWNVAVTGTDSDARVSAFTDDHSIESAGTGSRVTQLWLSGPAPTPLRNSSLIKLEYRTETFSARIGACRIWATGTFREAEIVRGDPDDDQAPIQYDDGRKLWVSGYLNNGNPSAVFWRKSGGPTLVTRTQRKYWYINRVDFITGVPTRAGMALPLSAHIPTQFMTHQLRGTCFFNAALNVILCCPALVNYIRRFLKHQLPALKQPPLCAYEHLLYAFLKDQLCVKGRFNTPARQSNAVSDIQTAITGKVVYGGSANEVLYILFLALRVSANYADAWEQTPEWTMKNGDGVPATTMVVVYRTHAVAALPELSQYVLVGAVLSSSVHAICVTRNFYGKYNVIVDNGVIANKQWYPTLVNDDVWNRVLYYPVIEVLGVYVHRTTLARNSGKPTRCASAVLPPVVVNAPACNAAKAAIHENMPFYTGTLTDYS